MTGISFRSTQVRLAAALFAALGILTAAGCASKVKKVVVTGKVTYKGKAVGWGDVRFFDTDGTLWSSARLNPDGTFTATDVPEGETQVAVYALPNISRPKKNGDKNGDSEDNFVPAGKTVAIPLKYEDPNLSGLRYTIGSETNQLDINLMEDKRPHRRRLKRPRPLTPDQL